jgi:prepilin-type N-terminal cleavage/methylation domain-containing protein
MVHRHAPDRRRPARSGRPPVRPARGFSLVELLIVVGIIGLLAMMLASVGAYAIAEGNRIQCCHNLRGLGLALHNYAHEHGDALPVSDRLEGPHKALVEKMAKYVDDPRIYYCPSEADPTWSYSDDNFKDGVIGYFYYICGQGPADPGLDPVLKNATWPRELTVVDPEPWKWVMSDRWFAGKPTAHRFAEQGVNYLTVGGEVQTVTEKVNEAFR